MTRLLGGVVAAGVSLVLASVPVYAHAELEESDPPDGETITTPYTLTATFSEPLEDRSRVQIFELGDSTELARGTVSANDPTVMTIDLDLTSGEYIARWTAVTADGGVTRGNFNFNVAGPPAANTDAGFTQLPTSPATSAVPTSPLPPTVGPTPAPTPTPPPDVGATASGNDILIALALAAVALLALGVYLFTRRR